MEHGSAKTSTNLNAASEKAGPLERTRALEGADVIPGEILLVLDAGVKLNINRQSKGQINTVASRILHYIILQLPYRLLPASNKSIKTSGYGPPPRRHVPIVFTALALRMSDPPYRFFAVLRFSPRCG